MDRLLDDMLALSDDESLPGLPEDDELAELTRESLGWLLDAADRGRSERPGSLENIRAALDLDVLGIPDRLIRDLVQPTMAQSMDALLASDAARVEIVAAMVGKVANMRASAEYPDDRAPTPTPAPTPAAPTPAAAAPAPKPAPTPAPDMTGLLAVDVPGHLALACLDDAGSTVGVTWLPVGGQPGTFMAVQMSDRVVIYLKKYTTADNGARLFQSTDAALVGQVVRALFDVFSGSPPLAGAVDRLRQLLATRA